MSGVNDLADDIPQGFILSDSAMYAYKDQDVFPDLISFCSAIPHHLRPLFLIPVRLQSIASSQISVAAVRVASFRVSDGAIPSGNTDESDWFGTKTFVYDDAEQTVPSSDSGSIFDVDGADEITHHQDLEQEQDQNYQVPTDTSYMSDVDVTDSGFQYPYRTEEAPVRHSTVLVVHFPRVALRPEDLEARAPEKVRDNAGSCSVKLVSYDKRGRVYTFSVTCGGGIRTVRAAMTDLEHVAMNCDCPFWRWNGPEFHASENSYMLGQPRGTAGPPDVRDPDRTYWLCKHAYAVLTRLDGYVSDVVQESTGLEDEEVLEEMDENWDELEEAVEIPLDEAEEKAVDLEWEEPEPEDSGEVDESFDESEELLKPEKLEERLDESEPEPEPEPVESEPEPAEERKKKIPEEEETDEEPEETDEVESR